jgi:hypothetical protein
MSCYASGCATFLVINKPYNNVACAHHDVGCTSFHAIAEYSRDFVRILHDVVRVPHDYRGVSSTVAPGSSDGDTR